jgi:hypothetical protein
VQLAAVLARAAIAGVGQLLEVERHAARLMRAHVGGVHVVVQRFLAHG